MYCTHHHRYNPRKALKVQKGISVIEPLITATVASVLVLSSVSGFGELKDRRRLESAVAQIESELQYARSTAVARGETIRVAFKAGAAGSCYVMHNGRPGDCSCSADGTAECTGGAELIRNVGLGTQDGLQLSSTAREVGFDAIHGTVTPTTTLQLSNRGGDRIRLVVNVMGRIRSCSASGSVADLAAC